MTHLDHNTFQNSSVQEIYMQSFLTPSLVMWSWRVLILQVYKNNHRCEWWCSWSACTQGPNI